MSKQNFIFCDTMKRFWFSSSGSMLWLLRSIYQDNSWSLSIPTLIGKISRDLDIMSKQAFHRELDRYITEKENIQISVQSRNRSNLRKQVMSS